MTTTTTTPLRKTKTTPDGFLAWQAKRTLEMHINTGYDLVKYRCKMKALTHANYLKETERKRHVYSIIEKNHKNDLGEILRDMVFYVTEYNPTCIDSPHEKVFIVIGDLVHKDFVDAVGRKLTRTIHLRDTFMSDLEKIVPMIVNEDTDQAARKALIELLCGNSKNATMCIYKTIIQKGMIECGFGFETLVVLDRIGKCSERALKEDWFGDSPFADLARRINKISKMFDPDIKKYEEFILDFCKTHNGD